MWPHPARSHRCAVVPVPRDTEVGPELETGAALDHRHDPEDEPHKPEEEGHAQSLTDERGEVGGHFQIYPKGT